MSLKKLVTVGLILIILMSCLMIFVPLVSADGDNWLIGWGYRQSHVINNATGAGTNYQVKIFVCNTTGVSSGNIAYLGSHVLSNNFGDVRFTDNDGSALLDYWKETVNSTCGTFWVEVADDLSTIAQTIYVYYGKVDTATTSNGVNTFLLFDDFLGSSLNTTKWGAYTLGSGTVTVGNSLLTLYVPAAQSSSAGIYSLSTFTYKALRFKGTFASGVSGNYQLLGFSKINSWGMNNIISAMVWDTENGRLYTSIGGVPTSTNVIMGKGVSHIYDITWQTNRVELLKDDGSLAVNTANVQTSANYVFPVIYTVVTSAFTTTIDWVCVRNFVYPEPVHSTWGSEESPPLFAVSFYFNEGGVFLVNGSFVGNGTSMDCEDLQGLEFLAVCDSGYGWLSWNWTNIIGSSVSNPYAYSVVNDSVIWCHFFSYNVVYSTGYGVGYSVGWLSGNATGYVNGVSSVDMNMYIIVGVIFGCVIAGIFIIVIFYKKR
jgi:hypothetical protein